MLEKVYKPRLLFSYYLLTTGLVNALTLGLSVKVAGTGILWR